MSLNEVIEYTEDGQKVVIPASLWAEIQELAEFIYLYDLIEKRKDSPGVITLDELLEREGISREELED